MSRVSPAREMLRDKYVAGFPAAGLGVWAQCPMVPVQGLPPHPTEMTLLKGRRSLLTGLCVLRWLWPEPSALSLLLVELRAECWESGVWRLSGEGSFFLAVWPSPPTYLPVLVSLSAEVTVIFHAQTLLGLNGTVRVLIQGCLLGRVRKGVKWFSLCFLLK